MPREKKTTLFSKNHITIEKYENLQFYYTTRQEINQDKTGRCYYGTSSIASRNIKKIEIEGKKIDDEHVEVTKESPLGFYYKQIVNITRQIQYGTRKTVVLEYHYKDTKYILSFFIEYDDNRVEQTEDSIRPWDVVPGDKDFSDNNIKALTQELEKLFDVIESNGCKNVGERPSFYSRYHGSNYHQPLNDVKRGIYKYMFGNPKGMRTQTNEEKILAHGFDLKSSFRKEKEL